jgi:catechol 2,3-dioxygenase-like lactoylglutathione lyase family enzyme
MIQQISAVTFAIRDMARSVAFYRKLGFELVYGGQRAAFSSLNAVAPSSIWLRVRDTGIAGGAGLFSASMTWTRTIGCCRLRD